MLTNNLTEVEVVVHIVGNEVKDVLLVGKTNVRIIKVLDAMGWKLKTRH